MKQFAFINFIVVFIVSFVVISARAQESVEDTIIDTLPGMEIVTIGDTKIMVHEGAKVYEKDGIIIVESVGQYTARKLKRSEERARDLNDTIENLQSKLQELKEVADDLQKKTQD